MKHFKDQIETILRSIKKSQSSFKVKTSVFLKKIQQMMFPQSQPPVQMSVDDANLLLKGIQSDKVEGLIQLCGNQATFGGLKKSAFYAVQILYRLLTQTKNKDEYLKIFYQLDSDEFKTMRLASHISQKKTDTSLKLCGIIKQKRYHLNIGDYIYSEQSQKIFQAWFKQHQSKKKQEQKKNIQWNQGPQVAGCVIITQNLKPVGSKPFKQSKSSKSKGKREPQAIDFYDQYLGDESDYFFDTYVDPIDLIISAKGQLTNDEIKRIRLENYKIISYLVMIPSRSIDITQIKGIVKQIHIESPSFDPKVLIKNFHSDLNKQEIVEYNKLFKDNVFQSKYSRQTFFSFHFNKLCDMEILFQNMYGFFGKAESVTGQASVGFELRTKIKTSINKLVQGTNPVIKLFAESQKIRKIILFLQNNKQFTKLPQKFKQLQDQKDYKQICHLFKKYIRLMRNYSSHPILKRLIENINHQLSLLRRQKLLDVYNAITLEQSDQFIKEVITLAQLFEQNIIEDYLIDRLLNEFIRYIQQQSSRFRVQNVNVVGNLMTRKDLSYFKTVVALSSQQTVNDGDLIAEYFRQKNSIKDKLTGKIDLNQQLSKVDELSIKLKQFMILSDKIQSGELDSYILKPKPEANRKKTNKSNKNFLASTLVQWYKLMFQYLNHAQNPQTHHIVKLGKMVVIINSFGLKQHKLLQQQNIKYYLQCLTKQINPKLKSDFSILKQDFNKNSYNSNLIDNFNLIIDKVSQISKFPLYSLKYIETLLIPFIINNLLKRPDTSNKNKKQLLTYSSMCKTLNNGRIILPHLLKIKSLLNYDDRIQDIFRDTLNKQSDKNMKQIATMYITCISKQYKQTLSQYKGAEFGVEVLDLVAENIFQVVEYSNNLYSEYKTVIIQALVNDLAYIKNNDAPKQLKKFYTQIQLIQMMSNRITTKKASSKFSQILSTRPILSQQQKKHKQNYLLKTRHKYQYQYESILDY